MRFSKTSKLVASMFLSISVLTASFGGAFATPAYAAPAEPQQVVTEEKSSNDTVLAGLAALALVAMLSKKGDSAKSGSAQPVAAPAPAASQSVNSPKQPTASQPTTTAKPTTTTATKPSTTTTATAPSYSSVPASGLTADEQKALELMNADRIANGLPTLKVNTQLVGLAERYAQDMINRGYFSHYDPEGRSPFDRMNQAGIGYKYAGENLAINSSVSAAEKAFMNSPGHRANILNPNYTEIGIGVKYAPNGSVYVVQEFIGK